MKTITIFNNMEVQLGNEAILKISECTDGWNIEVENPKDVRIGVSDMYGIHFYYVKDLISGMRKTL